MSENKPNKQIDRVLDHDYDGIQEYDNDLPRWWLAIFWGCFAFGIAYVVYFHVGSGRFTTQKIEEEMAVINSKQEAARVKTNSEISEEVLLQLASNQEALSGGAALFQEKCAACHLPDGGGLVGPNLTDNFWIHGGTLMEIRKTIVQGVPDKGMISWEALMTPEQINQTVAYLHTLRGKTPANPKEPQGTEFVYGQ